MLFRSVIVLIVCGAQAHALYEGDTCTVEGRAGVCKDVWQCQSALEDIRNRRNPQICTFGKVDPIVCCVERTETTTAGPAVTTTKRTTTTSTTEYEPLVYDYHTNTGDDGCEPLSPTLTSPKTGQKAWDKCVEYQEQLVYPCEVGVALIGAKSRGSHCHHNADELIVGGTDTAANEFPHMALLGFGNEENIKWQCGGSLISEKFILTAGHCIASRDDGPVTFAYIGALRRRDVTDPKKQHRIKNIIKHPEYKPPIKYNDIALLEMESALTLSQFTVPACLHVGDPVNDTRAVATGWGLTEYRGSTSDTLQKVTLTKFNRDECAEKYPKHRHMKAGIVETTQTCYGDKTMSKDTCQGDSGGPLQIRSKKISCMYVVVGVTSFGAACGFVGIPGIYTRVEPYVPWIESVVWP